MSRLLSLVVAVLLLLNVMPTAPTSAQIAACPSSDIRLFFVSQRDGNRKIYVANVDGSNPQKLTGHSAEDSSPNVNPRTGQVAFETNRNGNYEIMVMNPDGTNEQSLITSASSYDYGPVWSPDGTRLAFYSNRAGKLDIYVAMADGSNITKLTDNDQSNLGPSWSPDGQQLVFISGPSNLEDIYIMNADGSEIQRITENDAKEYGPLWSPTGDEIVFTSDRDGNDEIYIMNVDGTNVRRLTDNPAFDAPTGWSLDGSKVYFSSNRAGNTDIYVMNADGTNVEQLTDDPVNDYMAVEGCITEAPVDEAGAAETERPEASSSPHQLAVCPETGSRLVFSARPDNTGEAEIFVVNADGSGLQNLTNHPASDEVPSWSPNGTRIVFESDRDDGLGIYVMNTEGSDLSRISSARSGGRNPDWSPDGTLIVFVGRDGQLFTMEPDGANVTQLTSVDTSLDLPQWSPDGRRIAYSLYNNQNNQWELFVIDADGSNPQQLAADDSNGPVKLAWTSDSQEVVYITFEEGIWAVNVETGERRQLSTGGESVVAFDLSPDGRFLAYPVSTGFLEYDLAIQNLETGEVQQITDIGSPFIRNIAWEPCEAVAVEESADTSTSEPVAEAAESDVIRFVDVVFQDNFVVSLPEDWVFWRREDYVTTQAAAVGLRRVYDQAASQLALAGPLEGEVDLLVLSALQSDEPEKGYGHITIGAFPVSEVATQLNVAVDQLDAAEALEAFGLDVFGDISVNGRQAAFAFQQSSSEGVLPSIFAIYIFPEQDTVISITGHQNAALDARNASLIPLIVSSVRGLSEDYDVQAWTDLMEMDLPESFVLPAATQEEDAGTEASTDDAGTEAGTATQPQCTVSSSSNANLRGGPGTTYAVQGSLAAGTSADAIGQAVGTDGFVWWQLENQNWVRSDIVSETGDCDALPTVSP